MLVRWRGTLVNFERIYNQKFAKHLNLISDHEFFHAKKHIKNLINERNEIKNTVTSFNKLFNLPDYRKAMSSIDPQVLHQRQKQFKHRYYILSKALEEKQREFGIQLVSHHLEQNGVKNAF